MPPENPEYPLEIIDKLKALQELLEVASREEVNNDAGLIALLPQIRQSFNEVNELLPDIEPTDVLRLPDDQLSHGILRLIKDTMQKSVEEFSPEWSKFPRRSAVYEGVSHVRGALLLLAQLPQLSGGGEEASLSGRPVFPDAN